jgi:hypothetical protein
VSLYFLGLDLGKVNDHAALALVRLSKEAPPPKLGQRIVYYADGRVERERLPDPRHYYDVEWVERLPLGTDYPDILQYLKHRIDQPELRDRVNVILDHTGGGIPVYDFFRAARLNCRLIGLTITATGAPHWETATQVHVSKRDLISATQVALQCRTLRISPALPHAGTLQKELQNYQVKINPLTAHDSYNAREGEHDDLVLALCLAIWLPERRRAAGAWGRD